MLENQSILGVIKFSGFFASVFYNPCSKSLKVYRVDHGILQKTFLTQLPGFQLLTLKTNKLSKNVLREISERLKWASFLFHVKPQFPTTPAQETTFSKFTLYTMYKEVKSSKYQNIDNSKVQN